MIHSVLSLVVVALFLTVSPLARADVPPPDSCTTVGQACNSAGPTYDQPGTCVTSTCRRATPDGPVEYECARCIAGSGAGGAGPGAGGASAADAGEEPKKSSKSDDDGCSMGRGRPTAPTLFVVAALGLLAVRRKRLA